MVSLAFIKFKGLTILSIGLEDKEESPVKTESNFWDANKPINNLALVPELPR